MDRKHSHRAQQMAAIQCVGITATATEAEVAISHAEGGEPFLAL